ncbi:MAG: cytochrome P450 [Pseudomonadota bacterium]
MAAPPVYEIDPKAFWADPYPDLARMRAEAPIAHVPQLGATLITRRDTIFREEKRIDVFSSDQPEGLMTVLMGQNMMRKDGAAHMAERKAIFPTISPKTVKAHWLDRFRAATEEVLAELAPAGRCDLVADYAMPVSAHALRAITGLTNMAWREMDRVSQGMIDGCANYAGDPEVEAQCHDCTASIDHHIDEMIPVIDAAPDPSLLSVQRQAGLSDAQVRANIKLAISGGQNEPRDAIAGAAWAILSHPDQLALVQAGEATWLQVFEEYARWISPIGMSPRRVARPDTVDGVDFTPEERVFLMFSSGNRDETVFARPDAFDITQDCSAAISFGAGPHFCAGAWASRALIAEVALPMLFERLPGLRLDQTGETRFGGWAFRGPLAVPVVWDA